VLAYLFDELAMPAVRASVDVGNVASMRVLEKLGFRALGHRVVGGLDTAFFELSRAGRSGV
jgi:RimJ/RimL family protein N-acetyltransferase